MGAKILSECKSCCSPEVPVVKLPQVDPGPYQLDLINLEEVEVPTLWETQRQFFKSRHRELPGPPTTGYKFMATEDCKRLYDSFIFCGKLHKGVADGKCQIYFNDRHYFQGTFDKGKLTSKDCLMLYPDGTYFQGVAHGTFPNLKVQYSIGKVHYSDNCVFEGTFVNNKQQGKECRYYVPINDITYIGEWKNDMMNGRIREYQNGIVINERKYVNNLPIGEQFRTFGPQSVNDKVTSSRKSEKAEEIKGNSGIRFHQLAAIGRSVNATTI